MLEQLFALINFIYSIPDLIGWGGYLILFFIIFAETGLFIGFFLPGDSLLLTAGLFAAGGKLNIIILTISLTIAAIIGDSTGYWFGKKVGKKLFQKENSRFLKKKHLLKAKGFYDRHGGKTIILARFVPIIRTFAPIVAGATEMHYKKFLNYNIIGGVLWATGLTLIGYFIGSSIPNMEKHIGPLVIAVVILSFLPAIIGYIMEKRKKGKGHVDLPMPVPA